LLRTGHIDPGNGPWADTIETLIGLGDLDPARALLTRYDELCSRASRWSRIGCARCRGLLAAAEGDTARALESYELALAVDPARIHELERGRTLLALGALHRRERHNRSARDALQEALGIFVGLGAVPWAAKADGELGRIGGRRPPDKALTEAERRVASLAAQGRHNKEIAAEMFIAVSTVEAHLSRAYRKLGVRSRTELARHLANPVDAAVEP
jgi:DNA-binding CsgD family transcriptional regulator